MATTKEIAAWIFYRLDCAGFLNLSVGETGTLADVAEKITAGRKIVEEELEKRLAGAR